MCSWTSASPAFSLHRFTLGRLRATGTLQGATQLRAKRHAVCEHEARRNMTVPGGGGCHYPRSLRDLFRADVKCSVTARSDSGHGQPLLAHKGKYRRADVGARLRASLPAALLAGSQPYRRGVLQGQGVVARGRSPHLRGRGGDDRQGALGGHCPGRSRLLRALWASDRLLYDVLALRT